MHSIHQHMLGYVRRCSAVPLLTMLVVLSAPGKIAMLWLPSERGLLPAAPQ